MTSRPGEVAIHGERAGSKRSMSRRYSLNITTHGAISASITTQNKLKLYVTKKVGSASFKNTLTRKLSTKEVAWVKENRGLQRWVAKDVEIEEVLEHPFLEMMKAINPLQNQADMWMLTETFMGITGNCYWWMRPNNLGIPYQLWILETQRTVPVPGTSIDNPF